MRNKKGIKLINRMKNGQINRNAVQPGFIGSDGWSYHPTRGFKRDKTFRNAWVDPTKNELTNMIQTV